MKWIVVIMTIFSVSGCYPQIHAFSQNLTCYAHKDDPLPYNYCPPTEAQLANMEKDKY